VSHAYRRRGDPVEGRGSRKLDAVDWPKSTVGISEVSGEPVRKRLPKLGHAAVIGFLEPYLVYRGSPISCGRPHWPLYAPNHRDAANVVPSPAVLEWPQSDIVYPHDQGAALRRHAAGQGLGKLIRQSLLDPRRCRVAHVYAQRRDINSKIADRKARLRERVLTRDRREKRNRHAAYQSEGIHCPPPQKCSTLVWGLLFKLTRARVVFVSLLGSRRALALWTLILLLQLNGWAQPLS